MKNLKFVLFSLLFSFPLLMTGQSFTGDWLFEGTAEDGTKMTNRISVKDDGTMTVDFGNDGTEEVQMTYTMDGNKVSMVDHNEQSPCKGITGTYEVNVQGDICNVKLIEDACDPRRGDGKPSTMKRAN